MKAHNCKLRPIGSHDGFSISQRRRFKQFTTAVQKERARLDDFQECMRLSEEQQRIYLESNGDARLYALYDTTFKQQEKEIKIIRDKYVKLNDNPLFQLKMIQNRLAAFKAECAAVEEWNKKIVAERDAEKKKGSMMKAVKSRIEEQRCNAPSSQATPADKNSPKPQQSINRAKQVQNALSTGAGGSTHGGSQEQLNKQIRKESSHNVQAKATDKRRHCALSSLAPSKIINPQQHSHEAQQSQSASHTKAGRSAPRESPTKRSNEDIKEEFLRNVKAKAAAGCRFSIQRGQRPETQEQSPSATLAVPALSVKVESTSRLQKMANSPPAANTRGPMKVEFLPCDHFPQKHPRSLSSDLAMQMSMEIQSVSPPPATTRPSEAVNRISSVKQGKQPEVREDRTSARLASHASHAVEPTSDESAQDEQYPTQLALLREAASQQISEQEILARHALALDMVASQTVAQQQDSSSQQASLSTEASSSSRPCSPAHASSSSSSSPQIQQARAQHPLHQQIAEKQALINQLSAQLAQLKAQIPTTPSSHPPPSSPPPHPPKNTTLAAARTQTLSLLLDLERQTYPGPSRLASRLDKLHMTEEKCEIIGSVVRGWRERVGGR